MQAMKLISSLITALLGLFLLSGVYAATCPTEITQDSKGYWLSSQKPGWLSTRPTEKGITINPKNFAGVVYSPKRERLACVYRASNKKWVALISAIHGKVEINKAMQDRSGKNPAWKYSSKHKNYACGKPSVNGIEGCVFTFNHEKDSQNGSNHTNGFERR